MMLLDITYNFFVRDINFDQFSRNVRRAPTIYKRVPTTKRAAIGGFQDCMLWSLSQISTSRADRLSDIGFSFLNENIDCLERLTISNIILKTKVIITIDTTTATHKSESFEDEIESSILSMLSRINASLSLVVL
jgi:hypothetical protein